jgi:hypothetical protein
MNEWLEDGGTMLLIVFSEEGDSNQVRTMSSLKGSSPLQYCLESCFDPCHPGAVDLLFVYAAYISRPRPVTPSIISSHNEVGE